MGVGVCVDVGVEVGVGVWVDVGVGVWVEVKVTARVDSGVAVGSGVAIEDDVSAGLRQPMPVNAKTSETAMILQVLVLQLIPLLSPFGEDCQLTLV